VCRGIHDSHVCGDPMLGLGDETGSVELSPGVTDCAGGKSRGMWLLMKGCEEQHDRDATFVSVERRSREHKGRDLVLLHENSNVSGRGTNIYLSRSILSS